MLLSPLILCVIFVLFVLSQVVFWFYVITFLQKYENSSYRKILWFSIFLFVIIKLFFSHPYYGSQDDDDLYIYQTLYSMLFPKAGQELFLYGASENPYLINCILYPFFKLILIFNPHFKLFPSQITFFSLYSSLVMIFSFYLLIKLLFNETSPLPILILILSKCFFYFSRSLSYIFISHSFFISSLILLYFFKTEKTHKSLLLLSSLFLLFYSSFIKVDNRVFFLIYLVFWLNMNKEPLKKTFLYLLPVITIPFIFPSFFRRVMNYIHTKNIILAIKDIHFFIFKAPNSYLFLISFILSFFLFIENYFIVFYFFTFLIMYSFSYDTHLLLAQLRYTNALIVPSLLILIAFLNKKFFNKKEFFKTTIYLILFCLQLLSLLFNPIHYNRSECINYLESKSFKEISDVVYFPAIFGSRPVDYALILKMKNPYINIKPLSSVIENNKININFKKTYLRDIVIPDSCKYIPSSKISEIFTNLTINQIRPYCYDFKWGTVEHAFESYLESLNKTYSLKKINFLLIRFDFFTPGVSETHEIILDMFRSHCVVTPLKLSSKDLIRIYNITC